MNDGKKIIIIPDSFKGTMSSLEVCQIIKEELSKCLGEDIILTIPVADGGEGTVDSYINFTGASRIKTLTVGPYMEQITTEYAVNGTIAVIETASVAGYNLSHHIASPLDTTTYGLGLIIKDAIQRGCIKIILGLGGSCSNDGGAGLAAAMGTRFIDKNGKSFIPVGKTLEHIDTIDISETRKLLEGVEIIGMCDVSNPLYGANGAAMVFAPQKGASPQEALFLDEQLRCLSKSIRKNLHKDVRNMKGGGAAGGLGAGIHVFLNGRLTSGIDLMLDLVNFNTLLDNCSYVITGEGKLDCQSFNGKVVAGICKKANEKKVPVIIITGEKDIRLVELKKRGIVAVYETGKIDMSKSMAKIQAECRATMHREACNLSKFILKRNEL